MSTSGLQAESVCRVCGLALQSGGFDVVVKPSNLQREYRMSSDTAKENTSVVDSSLTECKHDVENADDPETSSHKRDNETISCGAAVQEHKCDQVINSGSICNSKLQGTRYFVIKSLNHENLQLSIEKGIWATQVMNEPILEEAFHNSGRVILIFSVNMSGFFQGYAQMMSSVGWRRDNVWSQASGKNPWGRSFKVKWIRLYDLPFQRTLHLKNPLNDFKPVKISRDCQELPQDIGEALCDLLDGKDDTNAKIERDDLLFKRPYVETHCGVLDHQWGTSSTFHPPLFCQHQAEANRFPFAQMPIVSGTSQVNWRKHSLINGSHTSAQLDRDSKAAVDGWGWPADRNHLASTLTEDEILEMSYEDYLELHSKRNKRSCHPDAGLSRKTRESMNKDHSDDSYSDSRSSKRSHHSSRK